MKPEPQAGSSLFNNKPLIINTFSNKKTSGHRTKASTKADK
jgi:hypothetical protein